MKTVRLTPIYDFEPLKNEKIMLNTQVYQEMLILRCVLRCIYANTLSIYISNENVQWKVGIANVVDNLKKSWLRWFNRCDIIHNMIVKEGRQKIVLNEDWGGQSCIHGGG